MRRLFAFGCSFTKYYWSTWADILGKEFDYFENWGKAGAGNMFIANSVVESSIKNKFTKDDTIMIMWSGMTREDRYLDKTNKWMVGGNIYTYNCYDEEFVKKYIHVRGCYIRDLAQIHLVSHYLEKIGCSHAFMSMVDLNNPTSKFHTDVSDEIDDLLEFYKDTLIKFKPSVHKIIFNNNWNSRPTQPNKERSNAHPIPSEHLEYLEKILPEYSISQETKDWVKKEDILVKSRNLKLSSIQSNVERL